MTFSLWVGPESAFLIGVPDVLMQIANQPVLFWLGMAISQFIFASKSSTDRIPQLKRCIIYHTNLTPFYIGLCPSPWEIYTEHVGGCGNDKAKIF